MQKILYSELRPALKTGDIVLFSGKGRISRWIKWFTASKWSHVGMVMCVPEWDMVLLYESTTLSNLKDLETRKAKKGVQLVPLSERVKLYNGEVSVRRLSHAIDESNKKKLKKLRAEFKTRNYEEGKIELVKSAWDGFWGENKEDLSSLFCSELVAESYQCMGVLKGENIGGLPSNEYTPKDFSSEGGIKLEGDFKLGKELLLKH